MQAVDTLIESRWVIPVRPRECVLEHHAVAIHGGRILDLLPTPLAHQRYEPARRFVLEHHAVLPGLINAHAHSAMSLLRGVADDLPLPRWLSERIWPLERAIVSADFVFDGTRLAAAEMLRAGITCCNDMYFYPAEAAQACAVWDCVRWWAYWRSIFPAAMQATPTITCVRVWQRAMR